MGRRQSEKEGDMRLVTWGTLIVLGAAVISCDNTRRTGPPKANRDTDMDNSPVPVQNSNAPETADWDGKSFITIKDVEEMGGDMKSPKPLEYSKDGSAHKYQIGLGELEMKIWAYTNNSGASDRFDKEKKEDNSNCTLLLKMNKASVAEISDPGFGGNAYLKKVIRADGWGIATYCVQKGSFVIKVMRAESCRGANELSEISDRGRKAIAYVVNKIK